MWPETQTLYSVTLFFALSSLLAWSHRRHRASRRFREALAATLRQGGEPVDPV
jgi:hypothetical protein